MSWARSLPGRQDYVKISLEQAEGSEPIVVIDGRSPTADMVIEPLLHYVQQIKSLNFVRHLWIDIQRFSRYYQPLPLLEELTLDTFGDGVGTLDSLTFFATAVNLKTFRIHLRSPILTHFRFPSLTSFRLSTSSTHVFRCEQLLDFLETSPELQDVHMEIAAGISLEGVPSKRVVHLPKVTEFTLTLNHGQSGYEVAAHLSCPLVKSTLLTHRILVKDMVPMEIFPASDLWKKIVGQYTASTVEEVTLELKTSPTISCSLIFLFNLVDTLELDFEVSADDKGGIHQPDETIYNSVLAQATRTIINHPHRSKFKRLAISHGIHNVSEVQTSHLAAQAAQLFGSLGPLDQLAIYSCDPRPYLLKHDTGNPVVFPPIRELVIWQPEGCSDSRVARVIERFAKSQCRAKRPLESLNVKTRTGANSKDFNKLLEIIDSVVLDPPTINCP